MISCTYAFLEPILVRAREPNVFFNDTLCAYYFRLLCELYHLIQCLIILENVRVRALSDFHSHNEGVNECPFHFIFRNLNVVASQSELYCISSILSYSIETLRKTNACHTVVAGPVLIVIVHFHCASIFTTPAVSELNIRKNI